MKVKLVLFVIINIFLINISFAEVGVDEIIIGVAFKGLATAFVATADIEKQKDKYIKEIKEMDEKTFNSKYADFYIYIKDLPQSVKIVHGITEDMNKEEAIKQIKLLNNEEMYNIIDTIPVEAIARPFKEYLSGKDRKKEGGNIIGEIKNFWDENVESPNK